MVLHHGGSRSGGVAQNRYNLNRKHRRGQKWQHGLAKSCFGRASFSQDFAFMWCTDREEGQRSV